jgi:hypothetical protein
MASDERIQAMGKMTATATISEQPVPLRAQLHCSGCGAIAEASCNCHMPYVPAGEVAAKAIKANPEKSNNAIAKEIGVGETTVRRIRGSPKGEPARRIRGTSKDVTARRIGKDGKSYPATKPKRKPERKLGAEEAYMARVEKAAALAKVPYTGNINDEAIALAKGVATEWNELADKLAEQRRALN